MKEAVDFVPHLISDWHPEREPFSGPEQE
jgi:hypothetical protein